MAAPSRRTSHTQLEIQIVEESLSNTGVKWKVYNIIIGWPYVSWTRSRSIITLSRRSCETYGVDRPRLAPIFLTSESNQKHRLARYLASKSHQIVKRSNYEVI